MKKSENFYNENIKKNKVEIESLNKTIDIVGWSRLLILLIGLFASYKIYKAQGLISGGISLIIAFLVFSIVAIIHGRIIAKRDILEINLEFSEKGLKRLNGEYKEFEDKGQD